MSETSPVIAQALRELVAAGPLAHVTTLNKDGGPQSSVIWMGFDGDDLVSGHMGRIQKVRNVERDPRTTVTFEAPRRPGVFLAEYAALTTTATVVEGGAWELLDRLAKVYMNPTATFPAPKADGGYVIHYRIDRINGVGPWIPDNDH
jgi:PPOX class probable F420-dependent enzyme